MFQIFSCILHVFSSQVNPGLLEIHPLSSTITYPICSQSLEVRLHYSLKVGISSFQWFCVVLFLLPKNKTLFTHKKGERANKKVQPQKKCSDSPFTHIKGKRPKKNRPKVKSPHFMAVPFLKQSDLGFSKHSPPQHGSKTASQVAGG